MPFDGKIISVEKKTISESVSFTSRQDFYFDIHQIKYNEQHKDKFIILYVVYLLNVEPLEIRMTKNTLNINQLRGKTIYVVSVQS